MEQPQMWFVVFTGSAICLALVMRRRSASKLVSRWLHQNGLVHDTRMKAKINVFVWPVRVTVCVLDQAGDCKVVELAVGEPRFGGWFNGKISCVSSQPAPSKLV